MAAASPPLPPQFKPIQHYIKTASEHDGRDQVVAYYCRLYALQKAMEIDKKSPECRNYLVHLMDVLEKTKKELKDEEAIQSEVVGQARVEEYALKIFLYADNEDRAGRFGKNVVKSFYTAGMLFDVLTNFGQLSEDIESSRKYAKWKAAYIHQCLKNGETPISGPMKEEGEEEDESQGPGAIGFSGVSQPGPSAPSQPPAQSPQNTLYTPGAHAPPTTPAEPPPAGGVPSQSTIPAARYEPPANTGGVQLSPAEFQKAQKYTKYAGSALQYNDSATAIDNLTKALNLLTTGKE